MTQFKDTLNNPISIRDRVLWGGSGSSYGGFYYGLHEVIKFTEKMVKLKPLTGRTSKDRYVRPEDLLVVNLILDDRDKQVCMCGDDIENHSLFSGHQPVSVYDYHRINESAEV